MANGTIFKGFIQVKEADDTYFHHLFIEDGTGNEEFTSNFLSHMPSLVSEENNLNLMKPFYEEEINNVVWAMESDKAPGPNGFSFHFYKVCWNKINTDLLRMVKSFQQKNKVGGSTNSTFLALIPKEVNPSTFGIFRPIYLCNVSYKILSKLLAN